jgi:hypothetical protein
MTTVWSHRGKGTPHIGFQFMFRRDEKARERGTKGLDKRYRGYSVCSTCFITLNEVLFLKGLRHLGGRRQHRRMTNSLSDAGGRYKMDESKHIHAEGF